MKKIGSLLFLLCCLALLGRGWHWAKDGFNIQRVRTAFPSEANETLPIYVAAALDQPFSYLGQGRQYYAFASEDGKYVLKLPRLDRYEVPFWMQACRFSFLDEYRKKVGSQRRHRLDFLLESSRIAFEEIREQTAVLYLHFHETKGPSYFSVISDRIGRHFKLDLNRTPFVLQEKKSLMASAFSDSLKSKDREKSKDILESFLKIIAIRSDKGIFNKDYSFLRNYGIDEKTGFEIDIGSFYRKNCDGAIVAKTAFQETVEHIGPWLKEIDPELQKWFLCKADEIQRN